MIVFASGKCVGYIVDNYLYDGASKLLPEQANASKMDLIKGESVVKHLGLSHTFLTEQEVADQYETLKLLQGTDLSNNGLFGKGRNHFI